MAVYTEELFKNIPTFEEFWAAFIKSREEWDRRQAEWDRQNEERKRQDAERKLREEILDAKFAKLQENLGGLNRSIGELIETLIAAHLWEKFPEYGLQRAYRRLPLYDKNNEMKGEIDILLVNTEWAIAVEVKREADERDVDRHIERMARILKYPPAQMVPGVKLLGAVAAGVITKEASDYAHRCGFFVLELTGESVIRVPSPPGFEPKEWR